jgi:hypothetical protein
MYKFLFIVNTTIAKFEVSFFHDLVLLSFKFVVGKYLIVLLNIFQVFYVCVCVYIYIYIIFIFILSSLFLFFNFECQLFCICFLFFLHVQN